MKKVYYTLGAVVLFLAGFGLASILTQKTSSQDIYGATSLHTIGGNLLVVGSASTTGNQDITGNTAITGTLNVTGATTLNTVSIATGTFSGNVPNIYSAALSAATTTASVANNSGASRIITSIEVIYASTSNSNAGTFVLVAGTSTNAYGTSTSPLINSFFTSLNGADVYTTSSTVYGTGGIHALWRTGETITFKSGTTTQIGTAKVMWY